MAGLKTVSFSQEVKEEVSRLSWPSECQRSLLSAYAKINGSFSRRNGEERLDLSSENAHIAKAIYSYIHSLYGVDVRFAYTRGMGFSKKVRYHVMIQDPDYILGDLEVDYYTPKIPKNVVLTDEQAGAYIAGAFLASGSVTDPKSTNYHLEIAFGSESDARWFTHLLNKVSSHHFSAKFTSRRAQWIVYIKHSEQIASFLALIGATSSCLKFEDVRVNRDYSNSINRLQNLDNANMNKTISAAQRQVEEIGFFVKRLGWDGIKNIKLRTLMRLRLENEDASLDELAEMMSEELASYVSKSNVNHLFRQLHQQYLESRHE